MGVLACGFNHLDVALAERERWALVPESWPTHLSAVHSSELEEAVIVSTCNRTELYAVADSRGAVEDYFQKLYAHTSTPLSGSLYWHESEEAVRHLMRVSSGLDSMCLGEPQILGQIKLAYQTACEAGTVGDHFKSLFPAAFSVGKQVRTKTDLGVGAVTLAYAVCQLVRQLYKTQEKRRVLCVGAGETIESMLEHLSGMSMLEIQLVNRTDEKAAQLAKQYQVNACRWDQLSAALSQADIVVTATGSQHPIISKTQVEQVCRNRQIEEPLFFADLAVPRDIEAAVADLPGVFLYNLDDMQQVLERNQSHRLFAAKKAQSIIEKEAVRFMERSKIAQSADVIKAYRTGCEKLRDQCLERALSQLRAGSDADLVLRRFASDLTKKLLHQPTRYLRDSISQDDAVSEDLRQRLLDSQKKQPTRDK